MFVVLAYDVGSRRVSKVLKIVKKYLSPVQRSIFQGFLTESKCEKLKRELGAVILPENDSVIIYKMPGTELMTVDEIGASEIRELFLL